MKHKLSAAVIAITVLLTFSYFAPFCQSQNYSISYQLLNETGGSVVYRLNVTVQQSLYDYYRGQSHTLHSENDFAKFVTPDALKPIADRLKEKYSDDEDFANSVLMIVHQIPYVGTMPVKYPVETIVENQGDCDLFSYLAASIMKAGGLDTVLLYYEGASHMNVGVSLSHAPQDAREPAYYVTYNHVRYYVAECTGGDLQNGWRVGEIPDDLKHVPVQVITLENCEQQAPGQVSATYENIETSTISLSVSSTLVFQGGSITFSGQLLPALQSENITIYGRINNSPWIVLGTAVTDSSGRFTYVWTADAVGICYVRASWSGNEDYIGADSPVQTLIIVSLFFILLLIVCAVLTCIGLAVYLTTRQTKQHTLETQPPQIHEIPS
jgi:hypothetical protein